MKEPKLLAPAKLCSWPARRVREVEPCGAPLLRGDCTNREYHMLPFPTGFCNSGWHEGYKINKPTCRYFMNCPCSCHQDIWFMFELAERERTLQDNSTFKIHSTFVLPSLQEIVEERITSMRTSSNTPPRIESPAPGVVPTSIVRPYAPTASGRAARGELEAWVKEATDTWSVESVLTACTPSWIAGEIAHRHGLGKRPSVGAVDAVLKRWKALGFAKIARQPNRFVSYTEEGIKFGLEFMKAKARLR